jgi:hypothetical protein
MRQTTHYDKITRVEYEFDESEIIKALMKDQDIPTYDSKRKRVEFEIDEENHAFLTLVFAESLPDKE